MPDVVAPVTKIDGSPGVPQGSETPSGRTASLTASSPVAPSVLFCDVSTSHPIADIRLSGELAADTIADLGAQLAALIRTGHHLLILDGHRLTHVSPACVGVLNRTAKGLLALGGDLILTGLSRTDADHLRNAGLHGTIRLTVADHVGAAPPRDTSAPDAASNRPPIDVPPAGRHPPKEERP